MTPLSKEEREELRRLLEECERPTWFTDQWCRVHAHSGRLVAIGEGCGTDKTRANVELISKSKNALPALLDSADEAERLRGTLEILQEAIEAAQDAEAFPSILGMKMEATIKAALKPPEVK